MAGMIGLLKYLVLYKNKYVVRVRWSEKVVRMECLPFATLDVGLD